MEDAVDGGEGGQGVLPVMEHDHEVLQHEEHNYIYLILVIC